VRKTRTRKPKFRPQKRRNLQEKSRQNFLARRKFRRFSNDFLHNSGTSFVSHAPAEESSYHRSEPRQYPSNNIIIITIIMIIIISRAIIGYNIISRAIISYSLISHGTIRYNSCYESLIWIDRQILFWRSQQETTYLVEPVYRVLPNWLW
jgi:hypothetical protein